MDEAAQRAALAVFRIEAPRLHAGLTRFTGDIALAEELAQDALVAALSRWPAQGIPERPGAWLMAVAKNRAIDEARKRRYAQARQDAAERELLPPPPPDPETALDEDVGDDLLRLMLIACHPVLSPEGRVALTLRLLGGLTTDEIARAFVVPPSTIAQRIVRAKRTLTEKRVPFEVPTGQALTERLASVLEVVYLIFNEGHSATAGDDWMRPELCQDALRLGRILQGLVPGEPEVHGLAALMELTASRLRARIGPSGEPVLLLDQDRGRWDHLLIRRGLAALDRARALGGEGGPYALQAEIAACHARAREAVQTDWARIASFYARLSRVMPSPIVELNRAVAISMAEGPAAALPLVEELARDPSLASYHLLPGVRADLLARLGRNAEAVEELRRAAALTRNARERALLLSRAARLS